MTSQTSTPAKEHVAQDGPSREELQLRVESLEFELELARRVQARLEGELRRVTRHAEALESDRSSIRTRLDDRERYLTAVRNSSAWRAIQWARGLVGRRW